MQALLKTCRPDICDGLLAKLEVLVGLADWQIRDATAEVVSCSLRRYGEHLEDRSPCIQPPGHGLNCCLYEHHGLLWPMSFFWKDNTNCRLIWFYCVSNFLKVGKFVTFSKRLKAKSVSASGEEGLCHLLTWWAWIGTGSWQTCRETDPRTPRHGPRQNYHS